MKRLFVCPGGILFGITHLTALCKFTVVYEILFPIILSLSLPSLNLYLSRKEYLEKHTWKMGAKNLLPKNIEIVLTKPFWGLRNFKKKFGIVENTEGIPFFVLVVAWKMKVMASKCVHWREAFVLTACTSNFSISGFEMVKVRIW